MKAQGQATDGVAAAAAQPVSAVALLGGAAKKRLTTRVSSASVASMNSTADKP